MREELPDYTQAETKEALLDAGASGTIYSLVMPESEAALAAIIDDRAHFLGLYREAWTQKQDTMHHEYFERWIDWSAPVVSFDASAFPNHYPTAGASEAIFKLMAEYAAECRSRGAAPSIHMFEGEYEGFPAYAAALGLPVVRHPRSDWRAVAEAGVPDHAQFWISQPSAIDGMLWPHFEAFAAALHGARPTAELVPDLTYVGSVARDYRIVLDAPNIQSLVISHSKPFGGYYHRVGGVLAKRERPSLFGNRWFKNLLSLAWGSEMMRRHAIQDLPRRYRPLQELAAHRCGEATGFALKAADISLLATAPWRDDIPTLLRSVGRGCREERVVRLCLTPAMAGLIAEHLGPR